MQNVIKKCINVFDKISTVFAGICAAACLINMVLLFLDILMRQLFKTSFAGATEYATLILMFVAFFGISYTHMKNRHMEMGAIYEKFSPKVRRIVDIVINGVILFVFIILFMASWNGFVTSVETKETMQAAVTVYRWPGRIAIVIGTLVFVLRTIFTFIESILIAAGGEKGQNIENSEQEESI